MARSLVSDELWALIEPFIPRVQRRYRYPGRKRLDDRKVLSGILFVLRTGIPWEYLRKERGCGTGMTCWRRLREWQEAGVSKAAARAVARETARGGADRLVAGDDRRLPCTSVLGGREDRGRARSTAQGAAPSNHLIACGRGTPLAVSLTGGNRNDITQLIPRVDAIPPVRGRRGRPRRLYGDRAYHSREGRRELRRRRIQARIAWPRSAHGSGLGTKRWVVERTIAWLHQDRRLRIRYERRDDIHEAFPPADDFAGVVESVRV
ncbi:MAG TPA: IS5 family transposase [Gaiellaceae bacterium]|nr:IS5 family transposase [Gaiellaceae bacterium]